MDDMNWPSEDIEEGEKTLWGRLKYIGKVVIIFLDELVVIAVIAYLLYIIFS